MPAKSKCPICAAASVTDFTPFCSRGCRDKDLLNWLGDAYRVPVTHDDDEDGTPDGEVD